MAFTAGQFLTAAMLNNMVRTFEALATSDLTVPQTTPTDIPGATVTFTTTNANAIAVAQYTFDLRLTVTGTGYVYGEVSVDASTQSQKALSVFQSAETRVSTGFTKRITLASAGSHTIKLQAHKDSAGGTAFMAGGGDCGLVVTVYDF